MSTRLSQRFDRWIFESFAVTPEGLGLYRIFFAAFALLFLTPGHSPLVDFAAAAALPEAFFLPPPGPMMLFSDFPPASVMHGVELLLTASLVALLLGYRTRLASVLAGALLLIGYGFAFSVGKINHVILFALLPLVMVASNWGAGYSMDALRTARPARRVHAWPLTMMALLVGFAMFTAGFSKLLGGWLDPTTQATQGHFVKHFFVRERQDLLAPIFASVEHPFFWEALDVATVAFEVGFLVAAFFPAATRLFAACAVLFHFSTMVMLNISFIFHLPVYAVFVDGARIDRALPVDLGAVFAHLDLHRGLTLMGAGAAAGLLYAFGSPLMTLNRLLPLASDLTAVEVLVLGTAVLLIALRVAWRLMPRRWLRRIG